VRNKKAGDVPTGRDGTKIRWRLATLYTGSTGVFKFKHATHPNPDQIKNTIVLIVAKRESGTGNERERERERRKE